MKAGDGEEGMWNVGQEEEEKRDERDRREKEGGENRTRERVRWGSGEITLEKSTGLDVGEKQTLI